MDAASVARHNRWVDVLNAAMKEIRRRGPDVKQRYLQLLDSNAPAVRLTAALVARDFAPEIAVPVLEELQDGQKYYSHITFEAKLALDGMRKRGEIPGTSS